MKKFKVKFSKRYQKKKHQLSKKKGSYLNKKKNIKRWCSGCKYDEISRIKYTAARTGGLTISGAI